MGVSTSALTKGWLIRGMPNWLPFCEGQHGVGGAGKAIEIFFPARLVCSSPLGPMVAILSSSILQPASLLVKAGPIPVC